jgi:hypothetical protein
VRVSKEFSLHPQEADLVVFLPGMLLIKAQPTQGTFCIETDSQFGTNWHVVQEDLGS